MNADDPPKPEIKESVKIKLETPSVDTTITNSQPMRSNSSKDNKDKENQKASASSTNEKESSNSSKRKKVGIACVYCRRSHMICDEDRPCKRCIKRNIGHLCHDEPAFKPKKSKKSEEPAPQPSSTNGLYPMPASLPNPTSGLQNIAPVSNGLGASAANNASSDRLRSLGIYTPTSGIPGYDINQDEQKSQQQVPPVQISGGQPLPQQQQQQQQQQQLQAATTGATRNPSSTTINQQPFFYSEHAGSEFNSLTEFLSMIDDTDMINSINSSNDPMLHKLEAYSNNNSTTNLQAQNYEPSLFDNHSNSGASGTASPQLSKKPSGNLTQLAVHNNINQLQQSLGGNQFDYQYQHQQLQHQQQQHMQQQIQHHQHQQQSLSTTASTQSIVPTASASTNTSTAAPYVSDSARDKFFLTAADPTTEISPEERLKQVINAKLEAGLLKPYNYAKGYQRLQTYMDTHMASSSRQRILKPLSTFRPGFRAIAKTLKDLDLILVEENFERMLLDYDRVFTSMAIPACLWRRTGEIYRGNKEFASLVDVSIDDLKNGKLTVYELMTEESSVNFWEKYGAIAFDKTQKAVLTSCNLRTKDGRKKKNCCFSFTIRRDRYNIPSCIVGNFIPIQ